MTKNYSKYSIYLSKTIKIQDTDYKAIWRKNPENPGKKSG